MFNLPCSGENWIISLCHRTLYTGGLPASSCCLHRAWQKYLQKGPPFGGAGRSCCSQTELDSPSLDHCASCQANTAAYGRISVREFFIPSTAFLFPLTFLFPPPKDFLPQVLPLKSSRKQTNPVENFQARSLVKDGVDAAQPTSTVLQAVLLGSCTSFPSPLSRGSEEAAAGSWRMTVQRMFAVLGSFVVSVFLMQCFDTTICCYLLSQALEIQVVVFKLGGQ